ncbi:hypothetical protein ACFO4E_04310 [Nocardiopsis mangrovi]|uniref:Spectinomycin phosphotransferase n=1 Tax=Nocardiopsis mangrovi TaxID=1179818 RepID=A0ABV9DSX9_9ACTN
MLYRPAELDDRDLLEALKEWGIDAGTAAYAAVGFGDHHWTATGGDGRRWFITVADLEQKTAPGVPVDAALEDLRRAMDTAADLRAGAAHGGTRGARPGDADGLDFVVAPLRTAGGATVRRLGERFALSAFPFATGEAGGFGREFDAAERREVVDLLAALHGRRPPASTPARPPRVPGRDGLDRVLAETDRPWTAGPFSEAARALLGGHAEGLRAGLARFDRLAERVARRTGDLVVTHGEPHRANLLRREGAAGGFLLVDWDTVGLAVPERDLWHVTADPGDLARYEAATGYAPDPSAMELYRLRWDVEELVIYAGWFRAPHERTADIEQAWAGLIESVERLAGRA